MLTQKDAGDVSNQKRNWIWKIPACDSKYGQEITLQTAGVITTPSFCLDSKLPTAAWAKIRYWGRDINEIICNNHSVGSFVRLKYF